LQLFLYYHLILQMPRFPIWTSFKGNRPDIYGITPRLKFTCQAAHISLNLS
jgi:hypothetical protein